MQGNLIAICLEQLTDPHPLLRQWLAICLGRVWYNYEAARWCAVRDSAADKLYCLLTDPLPEVITASSFRSMNKMNLLLNLNNDCNVACQYFPV